MRGAYVLKQPVQGSRHKFVEMIGRACSLELVPSLPAVKAHDFAVMLGVQKAEYAACVKSGLPYIFIANDVIGMRFPDRKSLEREVVLGAASVLANTPDTLAWLREEYGLRGGEVVYLRPLACDLDFEPLPKLPGRNLVYAGGVVADDPRYDYRDYRRVFSTLMECGWTVHVYPAWGYRRGLDHYAQIGCILHESRQQGPELYRHLSQYQAGFQGYATGKQQHYIEAARPNKLWDYLASGIPTLGLNPGRGGAIYDGKWGHVAQAVEDIPAVSESVLAMRIPEDVRRREVIDGDLPTFRRLLKPFASVTFPQSRKEEPDNMKVGVIGKGNICGQVSMVPPEIRKRHADVECYGFSVAQSTFAYPLDDHGVSPDFLASCDILTVAVTHTALSLFPTASPAAALVIHQHGHMDRKGDAPRSELELDRQRGAIRMVSTLNLLPYVGDDPGLWMPTMVNPAIETVQRIKRDDGRVRVVHSPSRRDRKHTAEIIEAVGLLQAQGLPVDLDIIEKLPNAECIRRKASGDICFDQLELQYGTSAVECMYLGIPVIVGMDDATDTRVREVTGLTPYVRATRESLASVLHSLVTDQKMRAEVGAVGSEYARRFHSADAVVERRMAIYLRALGKRPQPTTIRPRKSQYRLARAVDYNGVAYARGSRIDAETAIAMYHAGLITGHGL